MLSEYLVTLLINLSLLQGILHGYSYYEVCMDTVTIDTVTMVIDQVQWIILLFQYLNIRNYKCHENILVLGAITINLVNHCSVELPLGSQALDLINRINHVKVGSYLIPSPDRNDKLSTLVADVFLSSLYDILIGPSIPLDKGPVSPQSVKPATPTTVSSDMEY
ncbi:hypothetical protein BDB01DRAFT_837360 [Pilobolus umbonatus]|nr:hypothetical protein BDB01DRAFT_837360 [Pilobolus umbonatus]